MDWWRHASRYAGERMNSWMMTGNGWMDKWMENGRQTDRMDK